jgi:TnpA family transposase
VLVEDDARTGLTDHLTHAGGKVTRVPYDVLAWTAEWYFRGETLEAANAAIVNYHHRLPFTRAFGTGTLSSSDGQRFPV